MNSLVPHFYDRSIRCSGHYQSDCIQAGLLVVVGLAVSDNLFAIFQAPSPEVTDFASSGSFGIKVNLKLHVGLL